MPDGVLFEDKKDEPRAPGEVSKVTIPTGTSGVRVNLYGAAGLKIASTNEDVLANPIPASADGDNLRVPSLHGVSAITAGSSDVCALASGDLYCWGQGAFGDHVERRCRDDMTCTLRPHRMPVPASAPLVALSKNDVLDAQGAVYCWGARAGNAPWDAGACDEDCVRPTRKLLGLPPMTQIASAGLHACGLSTGHELVCWGNLESLHLTPTEKPTCAACEGPLFRVRE